MKQEISLEEIVVNSFDGHYDCDQKYKAFKAVKEAFELALDLAAENVKLTNFAQEFLQEGSSEAIDKSSILQIKDWTK